MYAVVETGGKQYKVAQGETFSVELLGAKGGDEVTFDQVLLVANGDNVTIGTPVVSGAKVVGEVVDHVREDKVIAFKFRRREGYHRKRGHRQQHSVVKIKSITV